LSSQSIVILIMGVCGSGKTLIGEMLAKKLGFEFADSDKYHSAANKAKMQSGIPLTDDDRYSWLVALASVLDEWLAEGKNGILACSALKESYRHILIKQPQRSHILFLNGSYDLIASRLQERQHEFMNPNLLHSQFDTLEEPQNAINLDISPTPEEIVESACQKLAAAEQVKGRVLAPAVQKS
jgi:gluconokinase